MGWDRRFFEFQKFGPADAFEERRSLVQRRRTLSRCFGAVCPVRNETVRSQRFYILVVFFILKRKSASGTRRLDCATTDATNYDDK